MVKAKAIWARPVTCEQQVDVCLYNLFDQPDPLLERTDHRPTIGCAITALITICESIYYVLHAIRTFLLTHLEQHCANRTDTHEVDGFRARDCLTSRAMGHLPHTEQYLLDQRVITCISPLQQLLLTLHLYATQVTLPCHFHT